MLIFFRYGCNNGEAARVSNTQLTILQKDVRFSFYYVHRSSKLLRNLTSVLPGDSNSLMISLSCFLEKRLALRSHLNHDRWPPHTLTLKLILDDTRVSCSTLEKWTKIFIASYARYLELLSSYFLFLMTFRLTSLPQVIYTALK